MGILTDDMKRVVEEQRLGFFATVCPDGTPNLSPKGTTAVWDDDHLIFANIRSPGTLANLRRNAGVEVNVVDPIVRKGYRFKGVAAILASGADHDRAIAFYEDRGFRVEAFREVVLVRVQHAEPLVSPAYDFGLTEEEVRARMLQRLGLVRIGPPPAAGSSRELESADDPLESLKAELERFGEANDAATNERSRSMLNITRDTGQFLSVLVRATGARRVLEIGTSNGYSTLWLAGAARAIGGSVTTIELAEYKVGLAAANFGKSGLAAFIRLVHDDAGGFLEQCDPAAYDFIFLDSERSRYPGWWPFLRRVLTPGGLLVADNATSHPGELAPLVALVTADAEFTASVVPVGKGEFLAVKAAG